MNGIEVYNAFLDAQQRHYKETKEKPEFITIRVENKRERKLREEMKYVQAMYLATYQIIYKINTNWIDITFKKGPEDVSKNTIKSAYREATNFLFGNSERDGSGI